MRGDRGFTLVELVVGIVVLAVAMMIMTTMLVSQSQHALEPLYRLRASQLGQGIMQNILTRSYDENSDHNGGFYRCDEIWGDTDLWYDFSSRQWQTTGVPEEVPCTEDTDYGVDDDIAGEHQEFNDVDDFITNDFEPAVSYGDVLGDDLSTQYNNYAIKIEVKLDTLNSNHKQIAVTIQTPSNEEIRFSALKGNY